MRVDLAFKRGEIHLTIEDFGNGFDLQAQKRKKRGLGLISMEERMRLVGGTLNHRLQARKRNQNSGANTTEE